MLASNFLQFSLCFLFFNPCRRISLEGTEFLPGILKILPHLCNPGWAGMVVDYSWLSSGSGEIHFQTPGVLLGNLATNKEIQNREDREMGRATALQKEIILLDQKSA